MQTELMTMDERVHTVSKLVRNGWRLVLINSVTGSELLTLLVCPDTGQLRFLRTELNGVRCYPSLTHSVPQAHYLERNLHDLFGLIPEHHLYLKSTHILRSNNNAFPLMLNPEPGTYPDACMQMLQVQGDGVYEIPVGPVHAGIIEPGHFRFNCYGEIILNLEIRLGYVRRGVEKGLTAVPWRKAHYLVEAAASDSPVAYAIAHLAALEALFSVEPSKYCLLLRSLALEVERVAMHTADLTGIAADVGASAVSSVFSRLRAIALAMAEALSGNRFMRNFIRPDGCTRKFSQPLIDSLLNLQEKFKAEFEMAVPFLLENPAVLDRLEGVGTVAKKDADSLGLVGVAARASGVRYDCRLSSNTYTASGYNICTESSGDVLARTQVRVAEVRCSIMMIASLAAELRDTVPDNRALPEVLPAETMGAALVESHRGELAHVIFTDQDSNICRYIIKDPSINNWTGLSVAVQNNIVADFPLCNKSFALSYSGHDL